MPYTTVMDLNFDPANYPWDPPIGTASPLAEAERWMSIMAGGLVNDTVVDHASLETLAHPKFVSDGADSHLLFSFAETEDIVEVAGAYSTKDDMDADLVPGNGVLVNCWDPDPTKRGRYSKSGGTGTGSWVLDGDGVIHDKAWNDYNHPQRLLELLICSWAYTASPLPFMGSPGYRGITDGNWIDARLTWDMRVRDLQLGPWAKIGQHVQGNVPARQAALEEYLGETNRYLLPNFIKKDELISDQLGFGRGSWGLPNDVPIVHDSGRRDVVINYTADDAAWECFGDPGRDPTGRTVNYGVEPVASVLADLHGNSFMLAHHVTPNDGAAWWSGNDSAAAIDDFDRIRGEIMIYGVKLESFAP